MCGCHGQNHTIKNFSHSCLANQQHAQPQFFNSTNQVCTCNRPYYIKICNKNGDNTHNNEQDISESSQYGNKSVIHCNSIQNNSHSNKKDK